MWTNAEGNMFRNLYFITNLIAFLASAPPRPSIMSLLFTNCNHYCSYNYHNDNSLTALFFFFERRDRKAHFPVGKGPDWFQWNSSKHSRRLHLRFHLTCWRITGERNSDIKGSTVGKVRSTCIKRCLRLWEKHLFPYFFSLSLSVFNGALDLPLHLHTLSSAREMKIDCPYLELYLIAPIVVDQLRDNKL